jgi:hypothetical protein
MKRQSSLHSHNSRQTKKVKRNTSRQEEELDVALIDKLSPDTILHILQYHELQLGCELERWQYLDNVTDGAEFLPTMEEQTLFLMNKCYGYFKASGNRQIYTIYKCISLVCSPNAQKFNVIGLIVTITGIVCLDLGSTGNAVMKNREINLNHIQQLKLTELVDPEHEIVSKCHNLQKLSISIDSDYLPQWNRLQYLELGSESSVPLSAIVKSCKQLKHLIVTSDDEAEFGPSLSDGDSFAVFPELQTLRINNMLPQQSIKLGPNLTSLTIDVDEGNLSEEEYRKLLTGTTLKTLSINLGDELIPESLYQYFSSNSSITHLDIHDETFWKNGYECVLKNRNIRHLGFGEDKKNTESGLFISDHDLFKQLESFCLYQPDYDSQIFGRLAKDAENLKKLTLSGAAENIHDNNCFKELRSLPNLEHVCFIAAELSELRLAFQNSVTRIEIMHSNVDEECLQSLALNQNLQHLYVHSELSPYEDAILPLLKMKTLKSLKLQLSKISLSAKCVTAVEQNNTLCMLKVGEISEKYRIPLLRASRHIADVTIVNAEVLVLY